MLLLFPGFASERGPSDLTARLLPAHGAPLRNHVSVFCGIGDRLSPVPFRGPRSRLVSCYAIFEGWLLLSPPPSCLRPRTPFVCTWSALWDLNRRLGSYPFGHQAYPRCPPPGFSGDRKFGVCQGTDGFLRLSAQTVALPHGPSSTETELRLISRGTSYSRPRLAFHPYAQVNRVICTSTSGRSSTSLSEGFNLPRHRSTGFGYLTDDSSRAHDVPRACALRTCRFRYGFPRKAVNLAVHPDSLARFSKRMIGRRSTLSGFVACAPYRPVATWFQALCTSRQGYFSAFTHATTALSVSGRI